MKTKMDRFLRQEPRTGTPVDPAIAAAWKARQESRKPRAFTPSAVTITIDGVRIKPEPVRCPENNPPGLLRALLETSRWSVRSLAVRMGVKPSSVRGMITRLRQKGAPVVKWVNRDGEITFGLKGAL